jgi:outer membrane murein-binding lipoprotein Lpp
MTLCRINQPSRPAGETRAGRQKPDGRTSRSTIGTEETFSMSRAPRDRAINDDYDDDLYRSPTRADFYRYEERRRDAIEQRNWIAIDKTTAMIMGAIASAALAVAIAGGTSLVEKVDETAKEVEKGRSERIESYGEVSKNISVVETKVSQMISQVSQLELRIERTLSHDFELRDKKIDQLESQINDLRYQLSDTGREQKRVR